MRQQNRGPPKSLLLLSFQGFKASPSFTSDGYGVKRMASKSGTIPARIPSKQLTWVDIICTWLCLKIRVPQKHVLWASLERTKGTQLQSRRQLGLSQVLCPRSPSCVGPAARWWMQRAALGRRCGGSWPPTSTQRPAAPGGWLVLCVCMCVSFLFCWGGVALRKIERETPVFRVRTVGDKAQMLWGHFIQITLIRPPFLRYPLRGPEQVEGRHSSALGGSILGHQDKGALGWLGLDPLQSTFQAPRPCIIKNLPIFQQAVEKWDVAYLAQHMGDQLCACPVEEEPLRNSPYC